MHIVTCVEDALQFERVGFRTDNSIVSIFFLGALVTNKAIRLEYYLKRDLHFAKGEIITVH